MTKANLNLFVSLDLNWTLFEKMFKPVITRCNQSHNPNEFVYADSELIKGCFQCLVITVIPPWPVPTLFYKMPDTCMLTAFAYSKSTMCPITNRLFTLLQWKESCSLQGNFSLHKFWWNFILQRLTNLARARTI